ncbi:hypothetical protein [Streptomyces sp. SID3343]|uniref:hypothetical protein n=1 Tax=Streptomyces sp. SID3343 TaxID=2690260 RepID=UPI001370B5A3|nr:hypothetical protein [Streptomyces sp. SID3343]MYV99370.1 hypothetical protein [Streptomyces sp. SID3343]
MTEDHSVWRHDGPGHARVAGAPISCRGSWTAAADAPTRIGPAQLDLLALVEGFAPAEPDVGVEVDGEAGARDGGDGVRVEAPVLFTDANS